MSGQDLESKGSDSPRSRRNWDALAAIIASFIGFLALLVAGYTAYIQRYTADIQAEQVRAQVWPNLIAGNDDDQFSIMVYNKGVGPAIVRSAQVWVNGKPQPDWRHVLDALGLEHHFTYSQATINPTVMSAGDTVPAIKFKDKDVYQRFRAAALRRHLTIAICYCSTLGECWRYRDEHLVGFKEGVVQTTQLAQCPRLPASEVFNN
jgi:hypothetical protein